MQRLAYFVPVILGIILVSGIGLIFLSDTRLIIGNKIKKAQVVKGKPASRHKRFVLLDKRRKNGYDREIYSGLITLNNISLAMKNRPISCDRILEYLTEGSDKLRPIYQKTLSLLRSGGQERAFKYFEDKVGTKRALRFASILRKLDSINPVELREQINMLKSSIANEISTEKVRRSIRNGNISMALSTLPVLLLIINFAYVVIILDVFDLLNKLY